MIIMKNINQMLIHVYIVVNHRPQNYDERLHFTILIFLLIIQFLRLATNKNLH